MPIRDVFYFNKKPNAHPRERFATSLADARQQSTTEHFWIITEFCDYRNFDWDWDFEFLPDEDVWAQYHDNVWPSQHQKDSGTWLCPRDHKGYIVYRADVDVVKRKNEITDQWKIFDDIDLTKFDFSWHPDPTDPPYIYRWGNKWIPAEVAPTVEYTVEGATDVKYMTKFVELLPKVIETELIDKTKFDVTWRPDPIEPPFIYRWGCKYFPVEEKHVLEYRVPGATEIKYMDEVLDLLPEWNRWTEIEKVNFDLSWRPDPKEPAYIYRWGCKYFPVEEKHVLEYCVPGAHDIKYMDQIVELLPEWDRWKEYDLVNKSNFDFTWRPDPIEPPFIYRWGCKYFPVEEKHVLEYRVPGATEIKYMDEVVELLPEWDNWKEYIKVDKNKFDFNWRPDPREPAFIYVWGNKYDPPEVKPTVEYHVPGATEKKYMDIVELEPEWERWVEVQEVDKAKFDFSWRPDPNAHEPPYIYVWGNKHIPGEIKSTIEYHVPGATEKKYMDEVVDLLPDWDKWTEVKLVDKTKFDFSWLPDPREPPFIYRWGCKYFPVEDQHVLEYCVPGATEIKYMDDIVELQPNYDRWNQLYPVTNFDFSWLPDPREPPFIYRWGCKYFPVEEQHVLEYTVDGATDIKYMDEIVELLPNPQNFNQLYPIADFDFSWLPDPKEPPFIYRWGCKFFPVQEQHVLEYCVPGATEIKYMDEMVELQPSYDKWNQLYPVTNFDFSWLPDPKEPPFIYRWGCRYFPVQEQHVLEYTVDGATDIKYMDEIVELQPSYDKWNQLYPIADFDFSWLPDPREPPFIYRWGCKFFPVQEQHVLEYCVPGATEIKYMDDIVELQPSYDKWKQLYPIADFDFSWVPDPKEPPFIYRWGCKFFPVQEQHVLEYVVPGAVDIKYMDEIVELLPSYDRWKQIAPIQNNKFDFSWLPDPKEPPFIYVFGNKQYSAEKMPTIEYHVPGATERKYVDNIKATLLPLWTFWQIPLDFDKDTFDFTWFPDPHSPPYIYQFGTLADKNGGPRYITPNNDGTVVYLEIGIQVKKYQIVTTLDDLVKQHADEVFWATRKNINYQDFDFSWRPELIDGSWESDYVSVFGSPDSETTQTYFVNAKAYKRGNTQLKFIDSTTLDEKTLTKLFVKPQMFFVDRYNTESIARFEQLKLRFPEIQKTRFVSNWVDTINRCVHKADTDLVWVLDSELDYTHFDFDYYPNPWQTKMIHVFGTQWSRWGTTYLVNKEAFPEDTKWVKVIEHLSMINFVKDRKAKITNCLYDVILVDHANPETPCTKELLETKTNKSVTTVQYDGSYLRTMRQLIALLPTKKEHYIWICSSMCDYSKFDFTYVADPFAKDQLHVFPSNKQKYGDTFLIDVNKTRLLIDSLSSLEDYEKINFNQTFSTTRHQVPTIVVNNDTMVEDVPNEWVYPYVNMVTSDNKDIVTIDDEPISLWSPRTKNIIVHSTGATKITVPKEAKEYIRKEIYDYPYIKKSTTIAKSLPQDIVFLSNGEKCADEHYDHLLNITKNLPNRVVRVDGVNGRVQAYHAAAEASNTPWMFTVFSKLKIKENFDFGYQPDRLQIPKHYIFYAENPVNGLVYGHQGLIMYNKKLVLNNTGSGLDFTLDDEHEVVEQVSGIAKFNTDPFATWRTAFREVIKLYQATDEVSRDRLDIWLTKATGDFAEYSIMGANDAIEYFKSVDGDFAKLRLSYEWAWLKQQFNDKY